MSRGGYRKTRVKLEAKLCDVAEKARSSDEAEIPIITIERGDLWIEGRVNKEGDCLNTQTKEVIDKIVSTLILLMELLFLQLTHKYY